MTELSTRPNDDAIVKADAEGIYLGNIFTVDSNLDLPAAGTHGASITWASDNEGVIAGDGRVRRPEAGEGNRTVVLTATVTSGKAAVTREFEVTVVEKERPQVITGIDEVYAETFAGIPPKLPYAVITIKEDGSRGAARVKWDVTEASSYAQEGTLKLEGAVDGTALKAVANIKVRTAAPEPATGPIPAAVRPFELGRVQLRDELFAGNRDRSYEYLLSLDDDRLLYNFRAAAGLDTGDAQPMTGWDAPDCRLKGHTTGHYLSALALAYASSGDDRFKRKLDYMVSALGECQEAMAASGKFSPGFLSGYSEEQFDKLEELTTYPTIWAPYYTLHKIIAGLLDCHQLAGSPKALDISKRLGDWVHARLGRLDRDRLNSMWALYIAGEYGGMNEVMARLYELTGKEEYLLCAKYFDNDHLFVPMAANADTLGGMHANQHVPQILGALRIFAVSGEMYYYNIARNFWEMAVGHHLYNIGGIGSGEMFKPPEMIARYITDKTAETCATYNMLKLTRNLFFYSPDAKYMDYYERALYNHIAASQDRSSPSGGSSYFMPLCPGARRSFDTDGNSCCHGTGMENHVKYQDSVYFRSKDEAALFINLYIPSVLEWRERGFNITQTGSYLTDGAVWITVDGSGCLDIKLRVPAWVEKGFTVKINGEEQTVAAVPGSYATLSRSWNRGDRIDISTPPSFRLERTPDDPTIGSLLYGPLVMVAKSGGDRYIELALEGKDISGAVKATADPLTFTVDGITLVPNFAAQDFPYHAYFKMIGDSSQF